MQNQQKQDNGIDNIQGLTALYDGVLHNLSLNQAADNAVEAKAVGVTALSLATIAFIVPMSDQWSELMIIGLLFLFGSLLSAFLSLKINDYRSAAVRVADHPEYLDNSDYDMLLQLISDAETSYELNAAITQRKAKYFTWSYALLLLGALISISSLKFMIVQI